jgi:hypothetical protein
MSKLLADHQELNTLPDVCAELLDHVQALNMDTRAFKRVQKMVEDERSL